MCVLGVIIFAGASALCGATPTGAIAETWIVAFRALQGLGGAIMFPAALAIVVQTFDLRSRGRALGIVMMVFIPVFFFASTYGQIALGEKATTASLLILYFFLGFVVFAQIGGRMLDRIGAKRPVVLGCVLSAVGFALWAGKVTSLHSGGQVIYIVMAGAGMGLMLGQANTDAVNRASRFSYGEATSITQTVRNYGASLGFAVLGTVLLTEFRSKITASLTAQGAPGPVASAQAAKIAQLQGGNGNVATIPAFIRADFAGATKEVLYVMAAIMAVAALVALRGLAWGVQKEDGEEGTSQLAGEGPDASLYPAR
jgi:MFS family permease